MYILRGAELVVYGGSWILGLGLLFEESSPYILDRLFYRIRTRRYKLYNRIGILNVLGYRNTSLANLRSALLRLGIGLRGVSS